MEVDPAFPKHLSRPDHRHVYNPLHVTNPSVSLYLPIQHDSSLPSIPAKLDRIKIAEAWSSDSDTGSKPAQVQPLLLTDRWSDNSDLDSSHGPLPVSANFGPETSSVPVLLPTFDAIKVAEAWTSGSEDSAPAATGSERVTPIEAPVSSALDIADKWLDEDKSEDDIPEEDQAYQPSPLYLANNWMDVESSEEILEPGPLEPVSRAQVEPVSLSEWSYRPQLSSFLEDVFDSSDEEPHLNICI